MAMPPAMTHRTLNTHSHLACPVPPSSANGEPGIVLVLTGTCALVYCRMVAQYVHAQPTLYDRVLTRQYYHEWDAEQKKKKAEEAAKSLAQKQEAATKIVAAAAAGAHNGCHENGASKVGNATQCRWGGADLFLFEFVNRPGASMLFFQQDGFDRCQAVVAALRSNRQ